MYQRNEQKHLETKIRIFEDMMLRTKNVYEAQKIRNEINGMRRKLQKLSYESLFRTLFFFTVAAFSKCRKMYILLLERR